MLSKLRRLTLPRLEVRQFDFRTVQNLTRQTESPLGMKVSKPTSVKRLRATLVRPHHALHTADFPLLSFTAALTPEGKP